MQLFYTSIQKCFGKWWWFFVLCSSNLSHSLHQYSVFKSDAVASLSIMILSSYFVIVILFRAKDIRFIWFGFFFDSSGECASYSSTTSFFRYTITKDTQAQRYTHQKNSDGCATNSNMRMWNQFCIVAHSFSLSSLHRVCTPSLLFSFYTRYKILTFVFSSEFS